jgi:hypothetical protein
MAMTVNRIGNSGPGVLDFGTAALAAVSAGFVAFAMPEGTFTAIVEAIRLPDLISAAQPPLGETARLAAVAAGAVVTFLLVLLLMRALDRVPARPRDTASPLPEAPRLRRADSHPDAPARRPLLARRELGEPDATTILDTADFVRPPEAFEPVEPVEPVEPIEPINTFQPAEPLGFSESAESPEIAEAPEPVEATEAAEEPDVAEDFAEHVEPAEPPKATIEAKPDPFADFLEPVEPEEDPWFSRPLPAARAEPAPAANAEPEEQPLELGADQAFDDSSDASTEAPRDEEEDSVSTLMQRLERGLHRRQKQPAPLESSGPASAPAPQAEQVGHRLRSAISELQKVASRDG